MSPVVIPGYALVHRDRSYDAAEQYPQWTQFYLESLLGYQLCPILVQKRASHHQIGLTSSNGSTIPGSLCWPPSVVVEIAVTRGLFLSEALLDVVVVEEARAAVE